MNLLTQYYEPENVTIAFSTFGNTEEPDEIHLMLTHGADGSGFFIQASHIDNALATLISSRVFSGAKIVFKRYFLSDASNQHSFLEQFEDKDTAYAVSVVQQPPLNGTKVAVWIYMVKNIEIIRKNNYSVAIRNGYQHIWTSNMQSDGVDSYHQTEEIFLNLENILTSENCILKDNCIRTWIYINNVDFNYGGVVTARKKFFAGRNLVPQTHYISSTGIEGRSNNCNSLVTTDSYSIKGLAEDQITFLKATTHLSPTYEYNVTFERGTVVHYGDRDHIFISGTASINHLGQVLYPHDVGKQIIRTMENIEALLQEAKSGPAEIAHLIIYLRDIADYKATEEFFHHHYKGIPKVIVHAPVCRPGWLVEVECMAVGARENERFANF